MTRVAICGCRPVDTNVKESLPERAPASMIPQHHATLARGYPVLLNNLELSAQKTVTAQQKCECPPQTAICQKRIARQRRPNDIGNGSYDPFRRAFSSLAFHKGPIEVIVWLRRGVPTVTIIFPSCCNGHTAGLNCPYRVDRVALPKRGLIRSVVGEISRQLPSLWNLPSHQRDPRI